MTLNELKQKFLDIIWKQNNLKGRVLDDFTEATEAYVEMFGEYPDCFYAKCNPDRDKTIENLKNTFECFFPGAYDYYEEKDGKIVLDKTIHDCNILTTSGIITIERDGITIYTNDTEFKDKVFSCYVGIVEEHPCEVYWISNGNKGFGASKLTIKDGLFNISSHYNEDFDYEKVSKFVQGQESGLIILHGDPGSGNFKSRLNLFVF